MFSSEELIFIAPEHTALYFSKGSFASRVWVFALDEGSAANANRDFLAKVLAAANLNLEKDTLFAEIYASEPVHFSTDLKNKEPQQVLVFGLMPRQLGLTIDVPLYKPVSFYGATWLFADALSVLEPDKTKKSQLWSALKQLFL